MVAKQPEGLLLDAAVIGTAPTVLNANGANQKKFDESLLARRSMKSQRARTNIFFETAALDAIGNLPSVSYKQKRRIPAVQRSRLGRDATVISSEELAQFRLIRPIRVQTCWSRPDDRGGKAGPPLATLASG